MFRALITCCVLLISGMVTGQNFITRWNTNLPGSTNTQIEIPTNPALSYNYSVDWGDGSSDTGVTGNITHDYASPGIYTIEISGVFPAIYFNNSSDRQKIIEIVDWGDGQWQSMENAFYGCVNLSFDAIDPPDLSQVTNLINTFRGCTSFNGIMNAWDVSTITDISGLFRECEIFNRPLDQWDTSNVTAMAYTFHRARDFNEPLDNWNVGAVTTLEYFMSEASDFNQNISNWNTTNVVNLNGAFRYTGSYNQPMAPWNVSNVTDMDGLFQGSAFNQPIENWNVSNVTTMMGTFRESQFNQPLENWDVSNVTNMAQMFHRNRTFDQPLNNWNVSNVTNMSGMFDGWIWGAVFNQPLDNWDVSNVTDMSFMFRENSAFNQNISGWDVSSVTNMRSMFLETPLFNQPLNGWDVSQVTDMSYMFGEANSFNQPLDGWDVSAVENMAFMFSQNTSFNQPLNAWDISQVTNLGGIFSASIYNQTLDNWEVSQVTNFSSAFSAALLFNQDLSSWDISSATNLNNMLSNSGLSQENYDALLIAWSALTVNSDLTLGATGLTYCDGRDARQLLIDNFNWSFSGDTVNCSFVFCTEIISPQDSDNQVPANSSIRWAAAPNATGYIVSLRRENGGTTQIIYDNADLGNIVRLDFTNEFTPGDTVFITVTPYNAEGPATGCEEVSFSVVDSWVNSPDAFKITIDTRNLDSNSTDDDQYRIEVNDGYPDYLAYNFSIDWGDGEYNNNVDDEIIHTYLVPGVYTIAIIGDFPSFYHNSSNRDNLKLISVDQWGTQVWRSMRNAFYFCENMEYNAPDIPDLSQVTTMESMFRRCYLFNTSINDWDVSNVTNMSTLFYQASIYNQPMDNWDVSNVTDMRRMFSAVPDFDQNIDSWDVSNVTNMEYMFDGATAFNQALNSWDVSSVTNMRGMFQRANAFDQPLNNWDTSSVTNMSSMFSNTQIFNQNIDSWDVSQVTNMSSMFSSTPLFDQPLNSWDVSEVTAMNNMFSSTTAFNQALGNWNTGKVTTMSSMFSNAQAFNQNIDSWNVTNVTDMSYMFSSARNFNQPLNSWDVNSVVSMQGTFRGALVFNQPLGNWNVSAVANMSQMFENAELFNQPINTWNVSSVTQMESMFEDALVFDQPIGGWNVSVVTNFDSMFKGASLFNQQLNSWDTGEALDMEGMFWGAEQFNQDLSNWNTAFVTSMRDMFREASSFNQGLESWNVASVNTMQSMFQDASSFNGQLDAWNVRNVSSMQDMFNGASSFNQPLNNWRVNNVSSMQSMFQEASSFNQNLDQWLIGAVSMRNMFTDATVFDQYLGDWSMNAVTDAFSMLDNTALSLENYDNTLIAWSEQSLPNGILFGAAGLVYCDALQERQSMIDSFGWVFSGDVLDCPLPQCTQLVSPLNGATDVPINTNLSWEPALYADAYELTITLLPSNTVINETTNQTTYEFGPGVLSLGDVVNVLITPTNIEGSATGCMEESFTISEPPSEPICTSLSLPLDGATEVSVTTDLEWNPVSNADGYILRVGTSPAGTEIVNDQDLGNVTSFDLPADLPENTTIHVLITPYNEVGQASGCSGEVFTTEIIPVPPNCTSLTSPLDGETGVLVDTNLSWEAQEGATGYLISIGTTSGGIEIANSLDLGNITTYDLPADLPADRLIFVRLTPYNAVGDASGCTEESFRTGSFSSTDPPACTSLAMPVNGAIDVAVTSDLSWDSVANGDGYFLSAGTSPGGTDILNAVNVTANTYDLPVDLPENTQIYVTVVPYNTNGQASGCAEESFTTETLPTPPPCTSLVEPHNGAVDVLVNTNLSWNPADTAEGYLLTVGTTPGGNELLDAVDVLTTMYDLPTDLPEDSQIYVTVVPYNAVGLASGCTEESFTTETLPTPPACTQLVQPLNMAVDVLVNTNLSWNPADTAEGYLLTVGTSPGGNELLDAVDVLTTTYDLPTDLPENTQIYVTVVPYNAVGLASGCTEESFTTETLPTPPACTQLVQPLNMAVDVPLNTSLNWETIPDADGYLLNVGTSPGGSELVDGLDLSSTTYDLPSDLPENSLIYVSIIPYNAIGLASGCTEESFITETLPTAPDCTSLINPVAGALNVALNTDLEWEAADGAEGYFLTVGTAPGAGDIINALDVTESSYSLDSDLPQNTRIYVMIVPYNSIGQASGCQEESFVTEIPPIREQYGFSPDGDGRNDYWLIDGIENYPNNLVMIYNRWGDKVFETNNYDNSSNVFRGEANQLTGIGARQLPEGTYFFHIQLITPQGPQISKGFLVLKR